jgi:hypothetical protein
MQNLDDYFKLMLKQSVKNSQNPANVDHPLSVFYHCQKLFKPVTEYLTRASVPVYILKSGR